MLFFSGELFLTIKYQSFVKQPQQISVNVATPGGFSKLQTLVFAVRGFGQSGICAKFCTLFLSIPAPFFIIVHYLEIPFMSLEKEDVEKIAHLARLGISEADVPGYVSNLSDILELVEQMSAVDTSGVTPMAHPLDAQQRLRVDAVTETDQREQLQANAPQVDAGLFLVPQVIE